MNKETRPAAPLINVRFVHILSVVLLSIAVYVDALRNGFVYDDNFQVLGNHWIKDIVNIPAIFRMGVWGFKGDASNYYRPMMHLVYMLDYHLFGFAPWGFHLINIILHTANCVLVFLVTERLLMGYQKCGSRSVFSISFMTAVIFAVHPIHTEAVTWVAGVPELTYAVFYLLSFYLYIISLREGGPENKWARFFSVFTFFISLLCKEPAITLPVILLGYDYAVNKCKDRPVVYFRRYLPYMLVVCVYIVARFLALGGFSPVNVYWKYSGYKYVINIFPLFGKYIEKLVLPLNLNAYYVFHPASSMFEARVLLSVLITVSFMVILFTLLKKRSLLSMGLILIFVTLLPALYIPGLGKNVFTERYLYLSVFGFALLMSLLVSRISARRPGLSGVLVVCFIGLIMLYSVGTISRNTVWKDEYTLWSDTVIKSPDGALPHDAFGEELFKKGLIDDAITEYKTAIRLEYDDMSPHINLADAYIKKGMLKNAFNECDIVLKREPRNSLIYNLLGVIYGKTGQPDKSVEMLQTSIMFDPGYAMAHNNLGFEYGEMGWMVKAAAEFQAAIDIDPDYAEAHSNLGVTYNIMGQTDKAEYQFKEAIALVPNDAISRENLNKILKQSNH